MPVVGRRSWIKARELRERIKIRHQHLDEFRRPPIAFVAPLRVVFDSLNQLLHRPIPLCGCRPHPKRQQLSSVGIDCGGRNFIQRIREFHLEVIAQHLKSGELANKVGVDKTTVEQVQNIADVSKLREGITEAVRLLQFSPQPDKYSKFDQGNLLSRSLRELKPQLVQAARFTIGEYAILLIVAIAE